MDDGGYEAVKPVVPVELGPVTEVVQHESKAIKTIIRRHTHGFSLTHYRRTFLHNGQCEVPGSTQWVTIRHQEWTCSKTFDWIHSSQVDQVPTEPIQGDIDD